MSQSSDNPNPRLTHVVVPVSNLERSIEFYRQHCDLEVVRDVRKDGGETVWLGKPPKDGCNPAFVLVLLAGDVGYCIDHLGFECASRAAVDELAERGRLGGFLVDGPADAGNILGYWVYLRDPDGHILEFTNGQPLDGLS